jgi:8-oxo-dGTP pyrophosphatase MutT (NUDIX family)
LQAFSSELRVNTQSFLAIIANMTRQRWKPSATVAAIMARNGEYLLVEEHTPEGLRLNNPAGHLDPGESPEQACAREAFEETAHHFEPTALVGIYLSRFQRNLGTGKPVQDVTYLRFAYSGHVGALVPGQPLDKGIVRAIWLTPEQIQNSQDRHRSPLVWQSVQDHMAGRSFDMGLVHTHPSVWDLHQH